MRWFILATGGIAVLSLANLAGANVTNVRDFHLGEADVPPAVAFAPGDPITVDSASAANASKVGNTFYDPAGLAPGSSFSMRFQNVDSRYVSGATGEPANFGMEAYVNPSSTVDAAVFYSGAGPRGAGIGIRSGQYVGLVGGVIVPSGVPVIPGSPVELALVDNGVTSFTVYVNDVAPLPATTVATYVPAVGADALVIGQWQQDQPVPFAGKVDDARIFQFVPGGFTPGDLGPAAVPEPAGVSVLALGAARLLRRRRRR